MAHNSTNPPILLTYTKPIENAGVADLLVLRLDGADISGTVDVSETQVTFTFDSDVQLNRCYEFDTEGSTWVGADHQDAVFDQQGTVCSPQVAVPVQGKPYALEASPKTLAILFGDGIAGSAISGGKILVDDVDDVVDDAEIPFDWSGAAFTMPAYTGTGLTDGAEVKLSLSGTYQNESLRVANTISLGAYTVLRPVVESEAVFATLAKGMTGAKAKLLDVNRKAFDMGMELARKN